MFLGQKLILKVGKNIISPLYRQTISSKAKTYSIQIEASYFMENGEPWFINIFHANLNSKSKNQFYEYE